MANLERVSVEGYKRPPSLFRRVVEGVAFAVALIGLYGFAGTYLA